MKTIKVRDLIRMLRRDGWELVKIKGDHRQFKHPTKKGKVTVNKKLSDDLDGDLLDNILKQAGLK
ncbi:MAG: type II toxin-antitoxin system HicA family toxin [Bacteroidales bacterium]|nr:type II toxin-antitoxin system HicA family toxin [Bacteroidales bacterium]MBQ9509599.1 type II toxin-antitoxin system HicA family toxin [Bacteroidales bacterium]MCQ2269646.1 type II toxin-antitoxin system HicA family toxin [Bacteroidales bacterium]MCQ2272724.1 type II toxin-antitoxin system HicA family toxin [Bacteroidales bacterium]